MNVYADLIDYADLKEDKRQLERFRDDPPHFLTVSAKSGD